MPAQLHRRRAASWRCEPLESALRDPWTDQHSDIWTDHEIDAWQATAEHLQAHHLYGRWQIPQSVRVAWFRRVCRCRCRGDAQ